MQTPGGNIGGYVSLFIVQFIFLIVFWVYVRYDAELLPEDKNGHKEEEGGHKPSYAHFQDIHVMIFIGFGFLMTFLKKYAYSSTGFTLFLAALVIQWAMIIKGFFKMENGAIRISMDTIIDADIAAAVPLISMGALLGRVTPIQLLFMGLIEIVVFAANEYVQLDLVKITDVGGSITVHAFGAYFGLAASFVLRPKKEENESGKHEGPSYTSDTFAMVGTLFLWLFWPSFNSALVDGNEQERAIVNTYLSLAAATVTTFILSALVSHDNKLDMVHIQNSTLAGGVAVGSVCNLLIGPHGAVLIGIVSGVVSVLGYRFLSPLLTSKLRIHDTCGVHNLHGMPAIISAIFSAIYACLAKKEDYKDTLIEIFPAMMKTTAKTTTKSVAALAGSILTNGTAASSNSTLEEELGKEFIIGGYGRSALEQGGYQMLAITLTVLVAIISGALTGLLLRSPNLRKLAKDEHHDDEIYWEVPAEKEQ